MTDERIGPGMISFVCGLVLTIDGCAVRATVKPPSLEIALGQARVERVLVIENGCGQRIERRDTTDGGSFSTTFSMIVGTIAGYLGGLW